MPTTIQLSLWDVIDRIGAHQPIRRESIEQLLHTKLTQSESSNAHFTFWSNRDSGPVTLRDGTQIDGIDLRTRNEPGASGDVTLKLTGPCISRSDVKARFGGMRLSGAPSGQSADEETTFTAGTVWGELVFGFAERSPDCLSSIGFGTKSR
ncbi:hypothetical protein KDW36_22865 [Burkholderia dolosa]|uniref:hypothetical protein n=1 Tax=Burkholderia dolosa TaxID=152500 RepID=UPI001B94E6B4|nr:hypothetical protein [Burkholderia dolosa]MBR8316024.1 hypothetical protein [Burkholderia dolosa]